MGLRGAADDLDTICRTHHIGMAPGGDTGRCYLPRGIGSLQHCPVPF